VAKRSIAPFLIATLLLCGMFSVTTQAADTPPIEKGLLITPLRQFPKADAGTTSHSSITIANLTEKPLTVALSTKEFSVTNYAYDYTFQPPKNSWLHLENNLVTLQPNQTKDIPYSIQVPTGSAPGGHYYTIFASANLSSQGIQNTIQAADLVYLTVSGKLTSVSHLQDSSISWISFGRDIPFNVQPINTGNIYSFVYVSGELHGLFVRPPVTSNAHMLMPGKVRSISDSIPSPILPGIYLAKYGYKTDAGWVIQQSHFVVFIPPWFIAFVLAALLFAGKYLTRKKHTNTDGTPADPADAEDIS
jgi:hypothetical protein